MTDQSQTPAVVGKALLASKSPWGTLLIGVIAYVASKWGLQLDDQTTDLIAGFAVLIGAYAARYFVQHPIRSVLPTTTTAPKAMAAFLALALGTPLTLAACSLTTNPTTGQTTVMPTPKAQQVENNVKAVLPVAYQFACAAVATADGTFKALAPGLEAKGKLTAAQVTQEAGIIALWNGRCASPAGDLTQLAADGMSDAASIYVMVAAAPSPPAPAAK